MSVAVLVAIVPLLPFSALERLFGYGGLFLVVFIAAAPKLHPDWGKLADGFVSTGRHVDLRGTSRWGDRGRADALRGVLLLLRAVEDGWTEKDLAVNKAKAVLGWALGGIFSAALTVVSAELFHPLGIEPDFLGTTALKALTAVWAYRVEPRGGAPRSRDMGSAGKDLAMAGVPIRAPRRMR
ncbi:MAG: hypothetical protein ICV69_11835 [Thermoleophilaceae bacterium]|nr:hypothetical protein [Thermoleophilaceae bacterium]